MWYSPVLKLAITPAVLWILFFATIIFWSIFSIVFVYHWNRYGQQTAIIVTAETIYFVVSIILIGLAFAALNLF